jgi:hypothetical protein
VFFVQRCHHRPVDQYCGQFGGIVNPDMARKISA